MYFSRTRRTSPSSLTSAVGWSLLASSMLLACGTNVVDTGELRPREISDGGAAPEPSVPEPEPASGFAPGVTLQAVTLNQAVSQQLMTSGEAMPTALPIAAGRDALLRVHYATDEAYDGAAVEVRLTVAGQEPLTEEVVLGGASNEADLDSTVNFRLPGAWLDGELSYRVDVMPTAGAGDDNADARFPSEASSWSTVAVASAGTLRITMVPVRYAADGSKRLPDLSESQLRRYRDEIQAMYPVSDLHIDVRAQPFQWNGGMQPGGGGWPELLTAIADLRTADDVPADTYYYGLVAPADSFAEYCGTSCVAGLGFRIGPEDAWARAAIGLGFTGEMTSGVFSHELGHNHGLEHAPCGTEGDPAYPHANASIGRHGYNLLTDELYEPKDHVDLMSYCDPAWISDFTFGRIHQRMLDVSGPQASAAVVGGNGGEPMARMLVGADGTLQPLTDASPSAGRVGGQSVQLHADGAALEGRYYPFDHIDGGVLFVPQDAHLETATAFELQIDGHIRPLTAPAR